MNTKRITLLISVAAMILLTAEAFAQRQGRQSRPPMNRAGQQANARQANGQQQGVGQGQSQQGGPGQGQGLDPTQVAERMMQNFDADGDGALNQQELIAGLTALQESMQQRRQQRPGQQGQRGAGGATAGNENAVQQQGPRGGRRGDPSAQARGPRGSGQANVRQQRRGR